MWQGGKEIAGALDTVDRSILPVLSLLLDGLIDSASLARPGVDADLHATELRNTAMQLSVMTGLIASVAPLAQSVGVPERMSA